MAARYSKTRVSRETGGHGGPPLQLFSTICFSVGVSLQGIDRISFGICDWDLNSCLNLCKFHLGFQKFHNGRRQLPCGISHTEIGERLSHLLIADSQQLFAGTDKGCRRTTLNAAADNCRGGPPWPPQRGNTMWNLGRPRRGRFPTVALPASDLIIVRSGQQLAFN